MALRGLSNTMLGRMANAFPHDVLVEKQSGRSAGIPTWETVGTYSGVVVQGSQYISGLAGNLSDYDATVIVLLPEPETFPDVKQKYRLTVTLHKSRRERELIDPTPEDATKGTKVYEVLDLTIPQDIEGGAVAGVFRVKAG